MIRLAGIAGDEGPDRLSQQRREGGAVGEAAAIFVEQMKIARIGQTGIQDSPCRGIIRRRSNQQEFFGVRVAWEELRQLPRAVGPTQREGRKGVSCRLVTIQAIVVCREPRSEG